MVDIVCKEFFAQPNHVQQRRYEALRSVFLDGRSQKEVAEEFGYQYDSLRQMVCEFRQWCHEAGNATASPFFEAALPDGDPPKRTRTSLPWLLIGAN